MRATARTTSTVTVRVTARMVASKGDNKSVFTASKEPLLAVMSI